MIYGTSQLDTRSSSHEWIALLWPDLFRYKNSSESKEKIKTEKFLYPSSASYSLISYSFGFSISFDEPPLTE